MKALQTVLVTALLLRSTSAVAAPKACDILITHGTILTMAGTTITSGSVAVTKGEIVAVGKSADIDPRFTPKEKIDARGMAVLPGFINTHTHAPMVLFRGIADDRDLMDWLQHFIFPAEARNVDRDFVRWGTRLAAAEMIRTGTTTFADMYYFEADIAREVKKAGLRGVLGETFIDFPAPDNKNWGDALHYMRDFAREFKGDSLITAALAPHAPYTVSADHLKEVRALATELGTPILIHLSETAEEIRQIGEKHQGMHSAEYLDSLGFLGHDVVAAHGIWLTPAEWTLLASRGVAVAHCPESNMMLASGIAPVVDLRAAGVVVGLGTDGPAGSNNNLDMIEEMASAARLQKIARKDPKALSASDVLHMATIDGARVLGLDKKVGSLEIGKRADIILIDLRGMRTQPVYSTESAIVYAANGEDVVTTIVDGRILMRDHKLLTIDLPATLAKAAEYRDKIMKSLEAPPQK
ncbi:MAG TPA: amidohydrolase [Thermoanaerobaculia bacterium]|nr:amidohydrolase [Thermoanaerobaculia bacterium]